MVDVCPGNDNNITPEQFAFEVATQDVLLPTLGAVQTYAKPQLGPSPGTRAVAEDLANLSEKFGNTGMGARGTVKRSTSKPSAPSKIASVTLTPSTHSSPGPIAWWCAPLPSAKPVEPH